MKSVVLRVGGTLRMGDKADDLRIGLMGNAKFQRGLAGALRTARGLVLVGACWLGVCLLLAGGVFAQVSSVLPKSTAAAAQNAPGTPDLLGRESPHGTVVGFIRAAQDEDYTRAVQYFEPSLKGHRTTPEQEQELAAELLAILNSRFAGSLDSVSSDPQGNLNDGLPADQERLGGTHGLSESFPLYLVRQDVHGTKLWLISRQTLDQVPEVYDSLRFPQLEKKLPNFLVKHRPLGMPLWQWLAIILFAPVALALGWLLAFLVRLIRQGIRKTRGQPALPPAPWRRIGPGMTLVAVIIHYNFVYLIGTSLLYRLYYQRIILIFLAFAGYWTLTRITAWAASRVGRRLTISGRLAERSLVSLGERALDVTLFIVVALAVLRVFNVNYNAALAGIGIGGLAIGLGAQKTLENVLGGISILTDKALVVGDVCRIGDQSGVVEDIGLRSTKLRTDSRTLVSIPNGTVATAVLENFRFRDKMLCKQVVRLRYDLTPDHVRYVLQQIRDVLINHAKVEQTSARVRLLKLGENALEVEVYAYILERDYNEYLNVQEDVLLQVMDVLDSTGAAVALPSQTTIVTMDKWVDPAKAEAAHKAMDKTRDPGVPGIGKKSIDT
ncbi:MAG TPA: mechanosensitive ion channel domain-containing protein [Candidatus Acidoferrum sp.]